MLSVCLDLNNSKQGISSQPCLLVPVTVHSIVPPRLKNSLEICLGKWPTILSSFFTETAYRSSASDGTLSHTKLSPIIIVVLMQFHNGAHGGATPLNQEGARDFISWYRIAGKFGSDLNLAVRALPPN